MINKIQQKFLAREQAAFSKTYSIVIYDNLQNQQFRNKDTKVKTNK